MANNDANFANNLKARYKIQNYVFKFFGDLVNWRVNKKNKHVAINENRIVNHLISNQESHIMVKIV